MNCYEINRILDAGSPETLATEARQAVDKHFASCRACRESWAAYRQIAETQIPKMPRQLRARVAAAVAERSTAAGTSAKRRWIGIGVVLVAGAALATAAVVQLVDRPRETVEIRRAPNTAPAPPSASASAPATKRRPAAAADAGVPSSRGAAPIGATLALDAHSIVVVSVPDPSVDARTTAELANCHDEIVRVLRRVDGMNVIADERIAEFAAAGFAEEEIARELGAGSALVLKSANREPSCSATLRDALTGEQRGISGIMFVGPNWTDAGWQSFAVAIAETVENEMIKDSSTVRAEMQAAAFNTALDDRARLNAMIELFHLTEPMPADAGVVAAAVQIGSSSRDADTREYAWYTLRGVDDGYVIEPLLHALANDSAANVRRAAALTLGYFADEPAVRAGLARAALDDSSPEVAAACCATVREAARYALLSDTERRAFALQTVLDETLSAEERLRPFNSSIDGRDVPLFDEAARAVFALGAADPSARSSAWYLLARVRNTEFKPTLLEDLAGHPAENVRAAAAWALGQYRDDANVRAALERATGDSSRHVQRIAREALTGD